MNFHSPCRANGEGETGSVPSIHAREPRAPRPGLQKAPRCSSGTRGQAPAACPSSPQPRPALTPPGEGPGEEGVPPTCDGHVADALLVHGGHEDHGLRRHHHGSRERLKHTEHDHGVRGHAARTTASRSVSPKTSWEGRHRAWSPVTEPQVRHGHPFNAPPTPPPQQLGWGQRGTAWPRGVVRLQTHG